MDSKIEIQNFDLIFQIVKSIAEEELWALLLLLLFLLHG